jgi:acyl-ACP thioesterase
MSDLFIKENMKMFEITHTISYSDVSTSGKADIAQIACFFQDCASFHSDSVGAGAQQLRSEKGCVWMLNSWQIEVDRYPEYGEKLRIVTNPYDFEKVFAKRNFMLYDETGTRIAAANSFWFMFDIGTMHPRRLTEDITSVYELGEKEPLREYAPRMIRYSKEEFEAAEQKEPILIRHSYCDTNRHMNNVWYIRLGLELLPEDYKVNAMRAEYRTGVFAGETIYPHIIDREGPVRRIVLEDAKGGVCTVLSFTGE